MLQQLQQEKSAGAGVGLGLAIMIFIHAGLTIHEPVLRPGILAAVALTLNPKP